MSVAASLKGIEEHKPRVLIDGGATHNLRNAGPNEYRKTRPVTVKLIGIADTLLHLPETFPAAYLKVYDPFITQCLGLSGALQHFDLAEMLGCSVPQLDKARLLESLVGYGFLTTAQYIADLFSVVSFLAGRP